MWAHGRIIADDPETIARGKESDDVVEFIRGRVAQLKEELLVESPFRSTRRGAGNLQERNVRVRGLTNSLASNDMLPAHSGYAKTRRRLLENGMELYELRPDTDAFRAGWSLLSGRLPRLARVTWEGQTRSQTIVAPRREDALCISKRADLLTGAKHDDVCSDKFWSGAKQHRPRLLLSGLTSIKPTLRARRQQVFGDHLAVTRPANFARNRLSPGARWTGVQ